MLEWRQVLGRENVRGWYCRLPISYANLTGGELSRVGRPIRFEYDGGCEEPNWVNRDCAAVLACRQVDQAPFLALEAETSKRIQNVMYRFLSECKRTFTGIVEGHMMLVDGFLMYGCEKERDVWISIAESTEEAVNLAVQEIIPEVSGLGFSVTLAESDLALLGPATMPSAMVMSRVQLDMQEVREHLEIGQIAVQSTFLPRDNDDYCHTFSTSGGLVFHSTCERTPAALRDERYNYKAEVYDLGRGPLKFVYNEVCLLKSSMKPLIKDIQIIGSIGVPRVKTKRTVDLMARVLNVDDPKIREVLRSLGYIEVPLKSPLLSRRKFFRKSRNGSDSLGCNLHILNESDWRSSRERTMRTYLLNRPEVATMYSSVKDYLVSATKGCAYHYGLRKDRFLRWLEGDLVKECCHHGE